MFEAFFRLYDRLPGRKVVIVCALNNCAWSHLILRGTQLLEIYLCIMLMTTSAVVFDTTFALGNFDYLPLATEMYPSLFISSGGGPAKSS